MPSMGFINASGMVLKKNKHKKNVPLFNSRQPITNLQQETNSIEVRVIEKGAICGNFLYTMERRPMMEYERFEHFEYPRLLICIGACLMVGK